MSSGGLAKDADRLLTLTKALNGDQAKPKQFFLSSGMNSSALEHSVPERLFSTPENPAQGISAVKALQFANEQGIPVYTINQTNINAVLPQLQVDADVKTDIQNAVNAGKEVTVSKTEITFNGWTGCGYVIIDPITGAGAYMISGGMNGGIMIVFALASSLLSLISSDAEAVDTISAEKSTFDEIISIFKDKLTVKCPDGSEAFIDRDIYWGCVFLQLTNVHIKQYAFGLGVFVLGPGPAKIVAIIGVINLAYTDAMTCRAQAAKCYPNQMN